jgi:hypothetical protein
MDDFSIEQVHLENFRTKTDLTGGIATLYLIGDLDMTYPDEILTPFFNNFHERVYTKGIKEVKLDVKELTFINSSSIKVILNWLLHKVKSLEESTNYKVKLVYKKDLLWQISAFKPLSIFVADCFTM